MAILETSDLSLPKHLTKEVWKKVQGGSVVAALSGSEPMLFGSTDIMTFTGLPKGEYVAEAGQKSSSEATFGIKTVAPHKVQVTVRVTDEVLWADEAYQTEILSSIVAASSEALSRALDLGAIHGINPLTGTSATSITDYLTQTTQVVANDSIDGIFAAAGEIIGSGFNPDGIALDPSFAFALASSRDTNGHRLYPEIGIGQNISNFEGLNAAVSNTVSGRPEAADTGIRGIIGDWGTLRWGVQKDIPLKLIQFGDPDGQGDLQRNNQVAIRAEVVYGWAFMDKNAFAVVEEADEEEAG